MRHTQPRHTQATVHACTTARHRCSICGEPIFLTAKGGGRNGLRWAHRDGRDHPARHDVGSCRVTPRDTRRKLG